jgi:hypothetical protein
MKLATYTNFSGGINDRLPLIINDLDSQQRYAEGLFYADEAKNFSCSTNGLSKVQGFASVLTATLGSSLIVTGIFVFNNALVVCTSNGSVYSISGSGVATSIFTGNTAGEYYYRGVTFNDALILVNGKDAPIRYNGTNCIAIAMTDPNSIWLNAKPKDVCVFRNRIFYVGDLTYPHRVYTPEPGTYHDFTSGVGSLVDAFDVEVGYGGPVMAMAVFSDDLSVIYKRECIRGLTGSTPFSSPSDPFRIVGLSDDTGCVATRTVVQVGKDHYFLGNNGLRSLKATQEYGNVTVGAPTYNVQGRLNLLNLAVQDKACAVYVPQENAIYLSFPSGSELGNSDTLVFHLPTGAIQARAGFSPAGYCVFNGKLHHGDGAGQVYRHGDTNSYNGTLINGEWRSKLVAHEGMSVLKQYHKLEIHAEAEGISNLGLRYGLLKRGEEVSYSKTWTIQGGAIWGSFLWGAENWGGQPITILSMKNLGRGNAIRLAFLNAALNERVTIRQVNLWYTPLGSVRG